MAALTGNPPFIRSTGGQRTLDGPATFNPDFPASTGAPAYSYDPRAATPYSLQYNVSVDQQLWKNTVLEVAYVGNRARNQLTNFNINPVLPQTASPLPLPPMHHRSTRSERWETIHSEGSTSSPARDVQITIRSKYCSRPVFGAIHSSRRPIRTGSQRLTSALAIQAAAAAILPFRTSIARIWITARRTLTGRTCSSRTRSSIFRP